MKEFLKHYLIPHKGNDYHPHLFKEASVLLVLFVAVFLFATSFGSSFVVRHTSLLGNVQSAVLVDLTNKDRLQSGNTVLAVSPLLTQAAQMKAQDMAEKSYFAHTSPEGLTPWHWFGEVKYAFSYAGENLAIDFRESQDVENAWLASPTHRANIMNTNFTEIGIATAEGMYQGHPTTFVVQMFGKPKKAKLTPVKEIEPKVQTTNPTLASAIETQPTVKGETVEAPPSYQIVSENEAMIVAQDVSNEEIDAGKEVESGSAISYETSFLGRIMLNQPHIVDYAYKLLIALLVVGLIFFIAHETRLQHTKHIVYGVLLLVILVSLTYINHVFMLTDKILM